MNRDKISAYCNIYFYRTSNKPQCSFALPYRNKESLQNVHRLQLTNTNNHKLHGTAFKMQWMYVPMRLKGIAS